MRMHVPYPGLPDRPAQPPGPPQRRIPSHIQHFSPPEIDPYQRLYRQRIIVLHGEIDDERANEIVTKLLDLDGENSDLEITLQLNSPGGSFGAMLAIYDTMEFVSAPVRTLCIGQADGPAVVLLASGTPGRRFVLPTAQLVLRQPSIPSTTADAQVELDKASWLRTKVEDILADRTGRPVERIHADTEHPTLLTATEAVGYGLADEVRQHR